MNQYFQAEYSVYVTVVVLCGAFGTSIVYPLLSLKLRVDDCVLGKLIFFWHFLSPTSCLSCCGRLLIQNPFYNTSILLSSRNNGKSELARVLYSDWSLWLSLVIKHDHSRHGNYQDLFVPLPHLYSIVLSQFRPSFANHAG